MLFNLYGHVEMGVFYQAGYDAGQIVGAFHGQNVGALRGWNCVGTSSVYSVVPDGRVLVQGMVPSLRVCQIWCGEKVRCSVVWLDCMAGSDGCRSDVHECR
jgi:hypothetical protein